MVMEVEGSTQFKEEDYEGGGGEGEEEDWEEDGPIDAGKLMIFFFALTR